MMRGSKKRTTTHIAEEASSVLLRNLLPPERVLRPYKPDYGIDFAVEVFVPSKDVFETAGEHFFVQLKAVSSLKTAKVKIYPRFNVEKEYRLDLDAEPIELDIIKHVLDVPLVRTADAMGSANPVLLFVCDTQTQKFYFLNINDYSDKVLRWENPNYVDQKHVTVEIPSANVLTGPTCDGMRAIRLYARRAKLYAAFNRFRYQFNELRHVEALPWVPHFLAIVLAMDIWEEGLGWQILDTLHRELLTLKEDVDSGEFTRRLAMCDEQDADALLEDPTGEVTSNRFMLHANIVSLWGRLAALGDIYEDVCREWNLPTYLGQITTV